MANGANRSLSQLFSHPNFRVAVTFGREGNLKANNKVSTPLSADIWNENTEWDLLLM